MNIVQMFEQMIAMHRDLADCLGKYQAQLVVNGFSREEALRIVIARQRDILIPPSRSSESQ